MLYRHIAYCESRHNFFVDELELSTQTGQRPWNAQHHLMFCQHGLHFLLLENIVGKRSINNYFAGQKVECNML